MSEQIGKLVHPLWQAVMSKDGTWISTDSSIEDILNTEYSPTTRNSPALGSFGRHHIHKAAADLDAKVVDLRPPTPSKPGVVY